MQGTDFAMMDNMQAFEPAFPWYGGFLQSVQTRFRSPPVPATRPRSMQLPVDDEGNYLSAQFHDAGENTPLIIMIHGLGGCESSSYMMASAAMFPQQGLSLLRLSLRGAGPSARTSKGLYHAGRTTDLASLLKALPDSLAGRPIGLMSISLGANMMLKALGDGVIDSFCTAACAISPPIDLLRASQHISRPTARIYDWFLVHHLRNTVTDAQIDEHWRQEALRARTLFQLDDYATGPMNGFADAEDYYRQCSAKSGLMNISRPTLIIHAQNDPMIPYDSFKSVDWSKNSHLSTAFPASGGHVGFHDRTGFWHLRTALGFFKTCF